MISDLGKLRIRTKAREKGREEERERERKEGRKKERTKALSNYELIIKNKPTRNGGRGSQ